MNKKLITNMKNLSQKILNKKDNTNLNYKKQHLNDLDTNPFDMRDGSSEKNDPNGYKIN